MNVDRVDTVVDNAVIDGLRPPDGIAPTVGRIRITVSNEVQPVGEVVAFH